MKKLKSYFLFSRDHRSGIFLLFLIIIIVQVLGYYFSFKSTTSTPPSAEEQEWIAMQNQIDSLKDIGQTIKNQIKPFNPNFISDYKGSLLGMSVQEIDRLHHFRAQDKYVNSAQEFQNITKVSDTLLQKIAPYFKFPDWVINKNNSKFKDYPNLYSKKIPDKKQITLKNINTATKEDLMSVYGIGDKISNTIIQERDKFGAFASLEQLQYIWGITPEAYEQLQKRFFIDKNPPIKKIDINNLTLKELSKFPYFDYNLARQIVMYRSANDAIKNIDDLTKIKGMPNEKIKIIALYLKF